MSGRNPHILKQTRGENRPSNVIFFDTETNTVPISEDERKLVLKLGVVQHCQTIKGERLKPQKDLVFTTPGELWDFIDNRSYSKRTNYLVAHNLGFDLAVTDGFTHLYRRGWKLESFYSKGVTSIFRWSEGDRKLLGVDNTNLFPGKLELWGEIMKVPKLSVDFDTVSDCELIIYCQRDVEIMRRSWLTWLDFLDENRCGAFKMTVGSTAFNTWRHRYMTARVHIHDNPLALQLERDSYRGGRTEVLFQGTLTDRHFYYLDVNSMYGYVLSRYMYPLGIYNALETDSISQLLKKLQNFAVVAQVDIETPEPWFPLKIDTHTCYPTGRFTTTLTTPELALCFQRGWIRGVHAMVWYRQGYLFSMFVKHFRDLRDTYERDGNRGYATICKLLTNSLYGKFGQMGFEQTQIGKTDISDIWTMYCYDMESQEYFQQTALAGGVYEQRRTGESYHSFPAIAAHVTAYARMHLYRLLRMVPPGHAYYMDTDSIIVDQVGYYALASMVQPGKMGYLKVELESDDLTIHAPKDYKMGERVRVKGIRPDAVQIRESEFLQDQWFGLAGLIRRGSLDGAIIKQTLKRQERIIFSGTVLPSGWVAPFVLEGFPPSRAAPLETLPLLPETHEQKSL